MNKRANRCRLFGVLDAILLVLSVGFGLALHASGTGPDPHSLQLARFRWNAAISTAGNVFNLTIIVEDLIFCILWSLSLACVLIRLRGPRPPFSRIMKQQGATAALTCTLIGIIAWAQASVNYVSRAYAPAMAKYFCLQSLSDRFFLRYCLGFAVAACWITLALGRRRCAERGWIDRMGVQLGIGWMLFCLFVHRAAL